MSYDLGKRRAWKHYNYRHRSSINAWSKKSELTKKRVSSGVARSPIMTRLQWQQQIAQSIAHLEILFVGMGPKIYRKTRAFARAGRQTHRETLGFLKSRVSNPTVSAHPISQFRANGNTIACERSNISDKTYFRLGAPQSRTSPQNIIKRLVLRGQVAQNILKRVVLRRHDAQNI